MRKSNKRIIENPQNVPVPEVFCEVALTYGQDISSRVSPPPRTGVVNAIGRAKLFGSSSGWGHES